MSFSTISALLKSRAGCHGTLGSSPEFSSPFLALVAVGRSLTPLGTARFSLVLPGQTIYLLQKESSAEVTWKVTPEWSPAPHCLSQPAFVLGFFPAHSHCPGHVTVGHTVVPTQEYYAAKFDIACLHSVTLGNHHPLSIVWTPCHDIFVTTGFQTSNGKPSAETSFILQHHTFLKSHG